MRRGFGPASLALLMVGLALPTEAQAKNSIADYMIMDVCVDATDRVVPGIAPGDAGCERRRNIRPGEPAPYELRNFLNPGRNCAEDGGTIIRLNRPVERDGETRIVSSNTPVPASRCGGGRERNEKMAEGGASIQWYDEGYGFIMGSYSPVALSIYQTPLCREGTDSSRRFFRGWVIAPAEVPKPGTGGFGVFQSRLATGSASKMPKSCPTRYRRALTTWFVAPMRYKSGRELTSIVSSHFAQVSRDGLSPGNTMQMEQSYWTREFGLSRWEKWARESWVHPRSGRTAPELARELYERGRCSPTVQGSVDISPRTRFADAPNVTDAYARTIVDPKTGKSQLWYMTLCEDYTNIHPLPAGTSPPDVSRMADPAYWKP